MRAEKGNKVYEISEADKKRYQEEGFDIYEDGKLIASGRGKMISFKEYENLKEENVKLKEKLKSAGEESDSEDVIAILTRYAQEHEINLGHAKTVSGIVKKIKEYQDSGAVPPEGSE